MDARAALNRAFKLTRYHYRVYLKRPIRRAYKRYYAWRHRPPTPEETARSIQHLQLSRHLYHEALDQNLTRLALDKLTQATIALNKARRLDRTTTVLLHDTQGDYEVGQDWMAYHYLMLEGLACYKLGNNAMDQPFTMDDGQRNDRWRECKKYMRCSIRAYEKAHRYNPKDAGPFIGIFDAYYSIETGSRPKARKAIKRALKLDPRNLEAQSRLQKINTGWRSLLTRWG